MRLRTLAAGMAALALALTACGDDSDGGGSSASIVDKAKNDKKLVIGIKYDPKSLAGKPVPVPATDPDGPPRTIALPLIALAVLALMLAIGIVAWRRWLIFEHGGPR